MQNSKPQNAVDPPFATLDAVPIGSCARVVGFQGLPPGQIAHLLGYGLSPGRRVTVLQQLPVTVVQVENTQIALESDMAGSVHVDDLRPISEQPCAAHPRPHARGLFRRRRAGLRHKS